VQENFQPGRDQGGQNMIKYLGISNTVVFAALFFPAMSLAAPVLDTGQSGCYDDKNVVDCPLEGDDFYGQDAQYRGNARSYTKLGENGEKLADSAINWIMVKDNTTGLVWEVKTRDGSVHDMHRLFTSAESETVFIRRLNTERFGGFSNWRIPDIKELNTLIMRDRYGPALDKDFFPNTASNYYWSSTLGTEELPGYWLLLFLNGNITREYRSQLYRARAVRGGSEVIEPIDNNDGTVTDKTTGLMWRKKSSGPFTWMEALRYCEELEFAGHKDWRLPDINELLSIVNYLNRNPAIDIKAFPGTASSYYWSSTSYIFHPDSAWMTNFFSGDINDNKKDYRYYCRAVRKANP